MKKTYVTPMALTVSSLERPLLYTASGYTPIEAGGSGGVNRGGVYAKPYSRWDGCWDHDSEE